MYAIALRSTRLPAGSAKSESERASQKATAVAPIGSGLVVVEPVPTRLRATVVRYCREQATVEFDGLANADRYQMAANLLPLIPDSAWTEIGEGDAYVDCVEAVDCSGMEMRSALMPTERKSAATDLDNLQVAIDALRALMMTTDNDMVAEKTSPILDQCEALITDISGAKSALLPFETKAAPQMPAFEDVDGKLKYLSIDVDATSAQLEAIRESYTATGDASAARAVLGELITYARGLEKDAQELAYALDRERSSVAEDYARYAKVLSDFQIAFMQVGDLAAEFDRDISNEGKSRSLQQRAATGEADPNESEAPATDEDYAAIDAGLTLIEGQWADGTWNDDAQAFLDELLAMTTAYPSEMTAFVDRLTMLADEVAGAVQEAA